MGRSSSAGDRSGRASRSSSRTTGDIWTDPVFAGCHRLNGNGELTGLEWVRESGFLGGAIGLTNTHSVGVVRDALVAHAARAHDPNAVFWSLPVVGETYDGGLNDINGFHVTSEHLDQALAAAASRPRRRGQRGWRDRHDLPRVQGRDRDGLAPRPGASTAAGPSERWCRRTTGRANCCGWMGSRSGRRSR